MAELLSSKVIVVEEEPRVRGIPSVSTSVAGVVGITERGPIGKPVLVTSPDEYEEAFGGFTPQGDVALAAMGFFDEGGAQLWVARTAHFDDPADPTSTTAVRAYGELTAPGGATPAEIMGAALPLRLMPADELVVSIGGAADVTVAFEAEPAELAVGSSAPFVLHDGDTLTLRFDEDGEEQGVVFAAAEFADIAAATALEVAAAINAQVRGGKAVVRAGALALRSDTEGRRSRVEVTGGPANDVLQFSTSPATGHGNVEDIRAVTLEEVQAAVLVVTPDAVADESADHALVLRTVATGDAATLEVRGPSAGALGFDTELHRGRSMSPVSIARVEGKDPGTYANRLEVVVREASSRATSELDLLVVREGTIRERFPNLSMDRSAARYCERVVNDPRAGSRLVRVVDLGATPTHVPPPQTVRLDHGDDGLAGLNDADFIGSEPGKTGLRALDRVLDLRIVFVPGRATPAVHQAMVAYCEVARRGAVFPILDPPAGMSAVEISEYAEVTAGLLGLSEHGALYWPRVRVRNPNRSVFGSDDTIVVAPSGVIAGVYARNDAARPGGVYEAPAGIERGRMLSVLGFETEEVLEEIKRDVVYPRRVNPLTTGPGLPRFIDGSRVLKGNGNFPFVGSRRGVSFIEESLRGGLEFVRHRNPTEDLLAEVERAARAFLIQQTEVDAFKSRDPDKAFFLEVSQKLVSVPGGVSSRVLLRAGLAMNAPAEFVVISVSQDTRVLEAELAAAGG